MVLRSTSNRHSVGIITVLALYGSRLNGYVSAVLTLCKSAMTGSPLPFSPELNQAIDNTAGFLKMVSFHPGNFLLFSGCYTSYRAYTDYHQSLDKAVQKSLQKKQIVQAESRDIGMVVASRALGIASRGTLGIFAIICSFGVYASGCTTLSQVLDAMYEKTRWKEDQSDMEKARGKRYDHPDYIATKGMTEDEELSYLYDTYFTDKSEKRASTSVGCVKE